MSLTTALKPEHTEIVVLLDQLESLGGHADLEAFRLILAERVRQMTVEGWSPSFDDENRREGQLASSAACYALVTSQRAWVHAKTGLQEVRPSAPLPAWPFSQVLWKPSSMRRNVEKATALLMAELARHIRGGIQ